MYSWYGGVTMLCDRMKEVPKTDTAVKIDATSKTIK